MSRISRYIFLELLKVFVVTLGALTGFVVVFFVVREALNQGLGPWEVLRMIPYALPWSLQLTLPGTLLFTACMVYGRMANANELVALKALGVSPKVPLMPIVVLSTVLSLVAVWLNDSTYWGAIGTQRVVLEAVESVAYGMLGAEQRYSSHGFSIAVQKVEGRTLVRPIITYRENNGSETQVTADEAELRADPASNALLITLRNMRVDLAGNVLRYNDPEEQTLPIPLDAASRAKRLEELSPAQLPLTEIRPRLKAQRQLIENLQEAMAAEATYQLVAGDFAALTGGQWEQKRGQVTDATMLLHRLETEPWRRWANGFVCLCFVLVGAPMAIRLRNAEVLSTFFLCFMPILVVYYPLLLVSTDRAKAGTLPPVAVWLSNGVLLLWGVWLLRRVFRY